MRVLATVMYVLALAPAERITAGETGSPSQTLLHAVDPSAGDTRSVPVRSEDQRHYALHQGGGLAVSSADLDQYLKQLQERATDRAFLLAFRDILFAPNSVKIGEQGRSDLAGMAKFLLAHPDTTALIIGHTDDNGEVRSNERLAEARAAAVRSFLIAQHVPEGRLESASGGEEDPIGDNRTSTGRDNNRRVQVLVQRRSAPAPERPGP